MADTAFLRRLAVFKDLLPRDMEIIEMILEEVSLPAGQHLFRQGDPAHGLYVIESGKVRVAKRLEDGSGEEFEVATLGAGEVIGEMSLVRNTTRSSSVITVESTSLFVLKRDQLATLMRKDLRIWAQIAYNIAGILASRLEHMDELLSRKPAAAAAAASAPAAPESRSFLARLLGG